MMQLQLISPQLGPQINHSNCQVRSNILFLVIVNFVE